MRWQRLHSPLVSRIRDDSRTNHLLLFFAAFADVALVGETGSSEFISHLPALLPAKPVGEGRRPARRVVEAYPSNLQKQPVLRDAARVGSKRIRGGIGPVAIV